MSAALDYLTKMRPEAMGHYFAFLKDCGRHLDPKTRALISVITKVHAQTERGLRQYLKRALRDGCTPAEILDALLMAFPALGLAKIVWAVDIILAMDLPQFRHDAQADATAATAATTATAEAAATDATGSWHDLMAADALAVGAARRVECGGRGLFVYRADDEWRVYDSRCPHQATDIPQTALQGTTLTCPKHGWAFDIRSGACTAVGDRALERRPSRVEDGRLLAHW